MGESIEVPFLTHVVWGLIERLIAEASAIGHLKSNCENKLSASQQVLIKPELNILLLS
jgi:hypothetical protein